MEVGDVDETKVSRGITSSLVKRGGEGSAIRDFVELLGVIVVQKNVKAEDVFDDGKGVFGCEGRHSPIVEDKASDGLSGVNLIGQLCLGEETIVNRVIWKTFENGRYIVAIDGNDN